MKQFKIFAALLVASLSLCACGGESKEQANNNDNQVNKVSVKEENVADKETESNSTSDKVSTSKNPLCDFAAIKCFDGVDSKDISSVEILGGKLTIGDLTSAKDIISKCSNLEIRNYASNAVFTTSNPEEVLNYTGELGNNMSDDQLLKVGGDETILCIFDEGKVQIHIYNNTGSDITLAEAIADNKYYIELEGNILTELSGDTTEDQMASLVSVFGAPNSILSTDKYISNLSEPTKEGYNQFTSMLVYKVGDFNFVIRSYEVLQGKDDVKSELTLKFETFYSEGLDLGGKTYVSVEFEKDGYKEF